MHESTTKSSSLSPQAGLSASITSLTPTTHRTCAKGPQEKNLMCSFPYGRERSSIPWIYQEMCEFRTTWGMYVGAIWFIFFMSSNFYRLDIHNTTTRVALANLQWNICKNWIGNQVSSYLVMVIRNACLFILYYTRRSFQLCSLLCSIHFKGFLCFRMWIVVEATIDSATTRVHCCLPHLKP